MLIIRLRRSGKKHDPHYRIVVQEKRSKLNGKYLESLGHYHPNLKDKTLVIDKGRADYWLAQGAKLSDTINNLFVKENILPKEAKISKVYSAKKKSGEEKAEAKPQVEEKTSSESENIAKDAESVETIELPASPKAEPKASEVAQESAEDTDAKEDKA